MAVTAVDKSRRSAATPAAEQGGPRARRNPKATKDRILKSAQAEFARHGFGGARVERIAKEARANVRMIYHYYGDKERLYIAALEHTYRSIRSLEQSLALDKEEPVAGMRRLIELTFDFLSTDQFFVRLMMVENLMMGRMVRHSKAIPEMTKPLLNTVETLLRRGQETNQFHIDIDPMHLYVAILALCFLHVSNRYTLSNMFQTDIADPEWLATRKAIVTDILMTYLVSGSEPRT